MGSYTAEMTETSIGFFAGDETCSIRRLATFSDDQDGGPSTALAITSPVSVGDTRIVAADPDGSGDVPAGLTVTIAGQAYVLTSAASAGAQGRDLELDVHPPALAAMTIGTAVALGEYVEWAGIPYIVLEATERDLAAGRESTTRLQVYTDDFAPLAGDIWLAQGRVETVVDVERGEARGERTIWELFVGGRA